MYVLSGRWIFFFAKWFSDTRKKSCFYICTIRTLRQKTIVHYYRPRKRYNKFTIGQRTTPRGQVAEMLRYLLSILFILKIHIIYTDIRLYDLQ